MIAYLKARLGERSTAAGLLALALAGLLVAVPFIAPPDRAAMVTANVQWLIGALFVGGLGGVLFPEKKS